MAYNVKLITADEVAKRIYALQRQLFNANTHFTIYTGIAGILAKHAKETANTPVFWNLTMQAHIDGAVTHLCRVYDVHEKALHLPALLNTIERHSHIFCETEFRKRHVNNPHMESLAKCPREIDPKQLGADKTFCSKNNELVKNLTRWRNNLISHLNEEQALAIKPPLSVSDPLRFEHIKSLIGGGYDILNRYSSLLDARTYSTQFASPQNTDYKYVLESLRYARVIKKWNYRKRMMQIKQLLKKKPVVGTL